MSDKPRGRAVPLQMKHIDVASGFGHNTRQPFVELTLGTEKTQMTPAKAREVAGMLLVAAEAAMSDGFVVTYIQQLADLQPEHAAAILLEFREWRERSQRAQNAHDWPSSPAA